MSASKVWDQGRPANRCGHNIRIVVGVGIARRKKFANLRRDRSGCLLERSITVTGRT